MHQDFGHILMIYQRLFSFTILLPNKVLELARATCRNFSAPIYVFKMILIHLFVVALHFTQNLRLGFLQPTFPQNNLYRKHRNLQPTKHLFNLGCHLVFGFCSSSSLAKLWGHRD